MLSAPPDFPHLFPFRSFESALAVPGFWISFDACEPSVCAWHALMCDKNPIGTQKSWTRFQAESCWLVNGSVCWWIYGLGGFLYVFIVLSSPFVIVHPHDMAEMIKNESSTVMSQKRQWWVNVCLLVKDLLYPPEELRQIWTWNSASRHHSVGGLEQLLFFHILGIIIPTD